MYSCISLGKILTSVSLVDITEARVWQDSEKFVPRAAPCRRSLRCTHVLYCSAQHEQGSNDGSGQGSNDGKQAVCCTHNCPVTLRKPYMAWQAALENWFSMWIRDPGSKGWVPSAVPPAEDRSCLSSETLPDTSSIRRFLSCLNKACFQVSLRLGKAEAQFQGPRRCKLWD